jgi:peroxiredoxin Q/BCP
MIQAGQPFPKFSLPNQDGKTVSLGDFAGKWLVVYVYPKDDTPGCTIQGKSFTATRNDFQAAGIEVVGVSQDDVASHKNFCNKFGFTIDLLADTNATLLKSAGVARRVQRHNVLEPHQFCHRHRGTCARSTRTSNQKGTTRHSSQTSRPCKENKQQHGVCNRNGISNRKR